MQVRVLLMVHQNSKVHRGSNRSNLFNFFSFNSSDLHKGSWDLSFLLLQVSGPLPHKPHPTTLSSYLKCQWLLPITPPHAKPEAQSTPAQASPPSLLSVCFHSSRTSVSPPPMCSCCFHPCQGLLCFSFGWPWNFNSFSSLLDSPAYPTAMPSPYIWLLLQNPMFWLYPENGVRTIYAQARYVWRTFGQTGHRGGS